jgi:ATP-dependent protease HslVU (ClpYQ) peptidase subunit
VIAADSKVTFGSTQIPFYNYHEKKIRKINDSYLASTGWGIYDDIFENYLNRHKTAKLDGKSQIFDFFISFYKELKEKYNFVNDQCDDKETPFADLDSSFLIANHNGIFYISSNMSVTKFEKFHAIGSGSDYSLGVLYSWYNETDDLSLLAKKAIDAAIAFNIYCGGDIQLETIDLK